MSEESNSAPQQTSQRFYSWNKDYSQYKEPITMVKELNGFLNEAVVDNAYQYEILLGNGWVKKEDYKGDDPAEKNKPASTKKK